MPLAAAIFDVDRTLLDGMSGHLFSRFVWKEGALGLKNKFRVTGTLAGYRLGILPEERLVEIGATFCAGMKISDLDKMAKKCVEKKISPRIFKEATRAIAGHKEQGERVFLASGSSSIIIRALAEYVDADGFVATTPQIENGICHKKVTYPLCYKSGKLELLKFLLDKEGIELENCCLYSDNYVDLPVFHKVALRYVVNPHAPLRFEAEKNGWEVLEWSTSRDSSYNVTGTSWPVKEGGRP